MFIEQDVRRIDAQLHGQGAHRFGFVIGLRAGRATQQDGLHTPLAVEGSGGGDAVGKDEGGRAIPAQPGAEDDCRGVRGCTAGGEDPARVTANEREARQQKGCCEEQEKQRKPDHRRPPRAAHAPDSTSAQEVDV